MALVASGKRKLLNNSPNNATASITTPKAAKRSMQTISGLINSSESASLSTRSSKKSDLTPTTKEMKRIGSYAKSGHIKNNTEFMHKSKMLNSPSSASSKFLSSKLRNNSTFTNANNISNNSSKPIGKTPKSFNVGGKSKKTLPDEAREIRESNVPVNSYSKENLEEQEAIYSRRLYEFKLDNLYSFFKEKKISF